MTLAELIRRFRVYARDNVQPYLSPDVDVTDWFNDAQAQAAVRGRLLVEDANPDVCRITLQAGQFSYPLHASVVEIIILRLIPVNGERPRSLKLVSREWLDATMPDWRDETRPAQWAIQNDTSLRVVGQFAAGDVLALECYRLPLEPMANEFDEPEINAAHHEKLIQWVLHRAFSVPDSEIFDPNRSRQAEAEFTAYFGAMPDADLRRKTREDVPHYNKVVFP